MSPAPMETAYRLVGESAAICRLRHTIQKLARSRSSVLLLGESGTGKEVVAHAIYEANPIGRFIPIDCGSLVGPLLESDLFGHTKGAFTGAASAKTGLLELADGGTAFFDEIGDLPLELQVKLLRVVQEREFRAVGSTEQHRVDLRIIAATHRDLAQRVAEGTFRHDLYYRLDVGRIRLPPLRERKEDIPLLVEHFLAALGSRHRFTASALELMQTYDWPGNVRELRNALERAVMLNTGPWIDIADLPTALQTQHRASLGLEQLAAAVATHSAPPVAFPAPLDLPPAITPLPQAERRAIEEALGFTRGDRCRAARLLQISRSTLYRKMKEYQIG